MNIHIDKEKFQVLMAAPRVEIFQVGSALYGINDENSDVDYLVIYYPFKNQVNNPFLNHHQYQYKDVEHNIDYNFVDIITFFKNLISGDSTINYELLQSGRFSLTDLEFMNDYKTLFDTYQIAKAYLGFAKRDINLFNKRSKEDKPSGLLHIKRSLLYSTDIIYVNIFNFHKHDLLESKKIFKNSSNDEYNYTLNIFKHAEKIYRNDLNKKLEEGSILRYLHPMVQKDIVAKLHDLDLYQNKNEIDLTDIYDANENPEIRYVH